MRNCLQEAEIVKYAKANNKQAATLLAKQLVNLRKQKARMIGTKTQLTGISHQAAVRKGCLLEVRMLDFLFFFVSVGDEVPSHCCKRNEDRRDCMVMIAHEFNSSMLSALLAQVMGSMNKQMDGAKLAQTMQEFAKYSTEMDLKNEISTACFGLVPSLLSTN